VRQTIIFAYVLLITAILSALAVSGQEFAGPVMWNPVLSSHALQKKIAKKTTAVLSLPFFDDFTGYSPIPDSSKWVDFEVYINNTMCVSPISRGVATFDDLNSTGIPYDSFSNTVVNYADSLTSQPIDLSADSVGDSLYLSFFYQPQGNGFYPTSSDSLMLYFKNKYGTFVKVWSVAGFDTPLSVVPAFQQVMVPLTDSLDFPNPTFQFRFVNTASMNWADADWNIDYVKLDRNRNVGDTTIGDVAFTSNPSFLLNDYTSMPYYQFTANPLSEIVSQVTDSIRNDTSLSQSINYSFATTDVGSGIPLSGSSGLSTVSLSGYTTAQVTEPISISGFPSYPPGASVIFETQYYLQSTPSTGPAVNDTIIHDQFFGNYLAYDDGTAEKSYYLELQTATPGRIAIEYHLNQPDTLRGLAIYFGRQVPFASYKPFIIDIYSALAGINGFPADNLLSASDLLNPAYADSVNHFWTYLLDTPLLLPAGIFYAGTSMSYDDGSDSLYFGLDVNRIGSNHAYFNVEGIWTPSSISGAIMMRPILGRAVPGSAVKNIYTNAVKWQVLPNPAENTVEFQFEDAQSATYNITDVQGHALIHGTISKNKTIDISALTPGMYFVTLTTNDVTGMPQKLIKL